MKQETSALPFETLPMPRKDVAELLSSRYRVYTDANTYTTIEATSALEALQLSGMKQAYRIQRDSLFLNNILKIDVLTTGKPKENKTAEAPSDASPAVTAEATSTPPEDAAPAAATATEGTNQ